MAGRKAVATMLALTALGALACGERDEPRRAPGRAVPETPKAPEEPARRDKRSPEPINQDPSNKPLNGYRKMAVGGVAPGHSGNAIVLVDDAERRGLVLTGAGIASSPLAIHLAHFDARGGGEHALLAAAVRKLGGAILSVRVDRLEDDVLYGSVLLARDGKILQLDARPGDALSLAVESEVPVFVADGVLTRAGVDLDKFDFRRFRRARDARDDEVSL